MILSRINRNTYEQNIKGTSSTRKKPEFIPSFPGEQYTDTLDIVDAEIFQFAGEPVSAEVLPPPAKTTKKNDAPLRLKLNEELEIIGDKKIPTRLAFFDAEAVNPVLNKDPLKSRLLEKTEKSVYVQGNFLRRRIIKRFIDNLAGIDGFERNLDLLCANNKNLNSGKFAEIARAYYLVKKDHPVDAIGKIVTTKLGKTDIDVLLKDGTWVENKDVKDIPADRDFKDKIDKMAEAVKTRQEVSGIPIKRAIFINSGKISEPAIRYAFSKGVMVFSHASPYQTHKILELLPIYKILIEGNPQLALEIARGGFIELMNYKGSRDIPM